MSLKKEQKGKERKIQPMQTVLLACIFLAIIEGIHQTRNSQIGELTPSQRTALLRLR